MTTSNPSGVPGRTRTRSFLCSYWARGHFFKTSSISLIIRGSSAAARVILRIHGFTAEEVRRFLKEEIARQPTRSKSSPWSERLLLISRDTLRWSGLGFSQLPEAVRARRKAARRFRSGTSIDPNKPAGRTLFACSWLGPNAQRRLVL